MDWTGGVRKRFAAGKNNANMLKQKQHFAKARAALQHTPSSQRTFRPAYLASKADHEGNGKVSCNARDREGHTSYNRRTTHSRKDPRPTRHSAYSNGGEHPGVSSKRGREDYPVSPRLRDDPRAQLSDRHDRNPRGASVSTRHGRDHQELKLLATRRDLLARSDWLGLSLARPLRMNYPSSTSRDRVGKRHKVDKPCREMRSPSRRLLTPLFEKRQLRPDYLMSGALPDEDIVVKIGTEALASQTQQSRRSRTPVHTSMRPPSTDLASLSEESMLLGAAGDDLEAYTTVPPRDSQPHMGSGAAHAPGAASVPQQIVADTAQMYSTPTYVQAPDDQPYHALSDESKIARIHGHAKSTEQSVEKVADSSLESVQQSRLCHTTKLDGPAVTLDQLHVESPREHTSECDKKQWRQMMHLPSYTSSHISLAAVKSSSEHCTTYSSSHRPALPKAVPRAAEPSPRSMHGGLDNTAVADGLAPGVCDPPPMPSTEAVSSSPTKVQDERFWRRYIFGDEDSSNLIKGLIQTAKPRSDSDIALAGNASSSLATSGLGTSNNATVGGTLFVTQDTSSDSHQHNGPWTGADTLRLPRPDCQADTFATNSLRPASEHDSIEDVHESPKPTRQSANIHAALGRVVKPYHYMRKASTGITARPSKKRQELARRGKEAKRPRRERDIYEIPVDSDGNSIA